MQVGKQHVLRIGELELTGSGGGKGAADQHALGVATSRHEIGPVCQPQSQVTVRIPAVLVMRINPLDALRCEWAGLIF